MGPPTAKKPPRQSSFSDWLAQESQNLRQSGHRYHVNNAQKTVRFNEDNNPNVISPGGIQGAIPEEGIPIDDDDVPPPAPPPNYPPAPNYPAPTPPYQTTGGVGAPGGQPLPGFSNGPSGGSRKIHFVPQHAYRNYNGHMPGNETIPEEPENYDLPPPPPEDHWNDGSLV